MFATYVCIFVYITNGGFIMSNKRSERRIRNNRIRRQRELKNHFSMAMMTICLVVSFSFGIGSFLSNAKDNADAASHKYYKSLMISSGDTLWTIAQEYIDTDHYDSLHDYINEIKRLNGMRGDDINYGEYLIVPYYDTDEGSASTPGNIDV